MLIDAGYALAFLLIYGLAAAAIAPRATAYPRALAALFLTVLVFGALDILPALVRGDRPLLDTESRLYSIRGLVMLTLIILVTAVTADWLRATTAVPDVVAIVTGFAAGVAVVLGPPVAYFWRRSRAGR